MRFLPAAVGAAIVTLALFWIMHTMTLGTESDFKKSRQEWAVQIVRLKTDKETQTQKQYTFKKHIPPQKPPTPKPISTAKVKQQALADRKMPMPELGNLQMIGGPSLGKITEISAISGEVANAIPAVEPGVVVESDLGSAGETVALVKISPRYPRKAARAGIQGWVKVEFTILEDGSVEDAVVVDAKPNRIFNREAIRAILKWKFKPKVVNGKPVKRRAAQKIGFDLRKV